MTQIEEMPPSDTKVGNFMEKAGTRGQSGLLLCVSMRKAIHNQRFKQQQNFFSVFQLEKRNKYDFLKEDGKQNRISFNKFCMNTFFSFPL